MSDCRTDPTPRSQVIAARGIALLLGITACNCYGVVDDEGLAHPTDDGGPGGTGTGGGNGTSTGRGTTGSGGATGAGSTGTGPGGATGMGGSGSAGTTGSGGATGKGGSGGTNTGGATGTGGASGGSSGAGTGGTAGAGTGGTGTGGTAGITGGTGGALDAGTGKGGTAGASGAAGTAGTGGGGLDAAVPPVCTSMTNWTSGNNAMMRPGDACVACHTTFTVAGTVYPTLHEPLNCNGKSGVQVVITPASGAAITLTTNSAGNFNSTTKIATPYSAKVVVNGVERAMMAKQTSGNCNSCHTQNGAQSAPGRITVP